MVIWGGGHTRNLFKQKIIYKLYVLHNDIPQNYQDLLKQTISPFADFASLEFINTNNTFATEWGKLALKNHFAKEVLYKLLLEKYFPQYDKIIISDVDVVFLGDVSESFLNFDCNSDYYISGVKGNNPEGILPLIGWKEGYKKFKPKEFKAIKNGVGGGYLIANLKAWRKDNIESKLVKYTADNVDKLVLAEQDVLNIVCYPNIGTLSPAHIVWNAAWKIYGENWESYKPNIYSQEELDNARKYPIQLHYIGDKKPWNYPSQPKSDIWYKYLCKTPFLEIHLQNVESIIINNYIKTTIPYRIKKFLKNNPFFFLDIRFYLKIIDKLHKRINK